MRIKTAATFLMIASAISFITQIGYLSLQLRAFREMGWDSSNLPYLFFSLLGFFLPIALFMLGWALTSNLPDDNERFFGGR